MSWISEWLGARGFEHLVDLFEENEIDEEILFDLTSDDLKEIGLSLGARKKLLKAISGAPATTPREQSAADASEASTSPQQPNQTNIEAERRQLTVMFIDMVGSTALSGQLDPEDLRAVITHYQNTIAGVVSRFEGHIAKFMGDGVLCYFGWPRAHEDAAERAVRAGLSGIEAARSVTLPNGDAIGVRVGIATGMVVVGDLIGEGAAQEEAVVGETPNLAARLQDQAQPGEVVVSDQTRRLIGENFQLQDLGALTLKGIEGITTAFKVAGENQIESRFDAHTRRHLSSMIGRDHELDLILERWSRAKSGEGQLLILSGDAGIGKSRIVRAMTDAIADTPHIRVGYQCSPYHMDSSLYPAIRHLNFAAGIRETDSTTEKLEKLEAIVSLEEAPLIAALLGLDGGERYGPSDLTPQQQRNQTLLALSRQLTVLSKDKPVLFIVEDAHWIDATTLELLNTGLDQHANERVFILVTARPNFDHGFGGHPIVSKLSLNRLGQDQVTDIVLKITGGKALPHEVLAEIAMRTDGVPLFVEELVKTVIESGDLRETETRFELKGPLSRLSIPSTLHDSLMARLDRLQPIKEIAQLAACIGREFEYSLIEQVSNLTAAALQDALDQLVAAEIIFRRGTFPDAGFTFKHALVRDAAYESLLRSRRQSNHGKLVAVLEQDSSVAPELIAHHATQAGLNERAVELWTEAGKIALAQPAYAEAAGHLNAALSLIEQVKDPEEWRERELSLNVQLAQVYVALKGYGAPETGAVFDRAAELADQTKNPELLTAVHYGRWIGPYIRGEVQQLLTIAEQVVEQVAPLNHPVSSLIAHRMRAASLISVGKPAQALDDLDISYSLYEENISPDFASHFPQEPGVQIKCYQLLGRWLTGYPEQGLEIAEQAVASGRDLQHANTLCYAGLHQCALAILAQDAVLLRRSNDEVLAVAKKHDMSMWVSFFTIHDALIDAGSNMDSALVRFEKELHAFTVNGNGLWSPLYLMDIARQLLDAGEPTKAEEYIGKSLRLIEEKGETWVEPELHRLQGKVYLQRSKEDDALAAFERAIELAKMQNSKMFELRAVMDLCQHWVSLDDRARARDLLTPLYQWFREGHQLPDLKRAASLLQEIEAA